MGHYLWVAKYILFVVQHVKPTKTKVLKAFPKLFGGNQKKNVGHCHSV